MMMTTTTTTTTTTAPAADEKCTRTLFERNWRDATLWQTWEDRVHWQDPKNTVTKFSLQQKVKRSRPCKQLSSFQKAFSSMELIMTKMMMTNCHHHLSSQVSFPLVLILLSQCCTPPLRLQISNCCTFFIMCAVPRAAVCFCRESTECSPGIVSRYFLSPLVTIPVATTDYHLDEIFHIPHSMNFYI